MLTPKLSDIASVPQEVLEEQTTNNNKRASTPNTHAMIIENQNPLKEPKQLLPTLYHLKEPKQQLPILIKPPSTPKVSDTVLVPQVPEVLVLPNHYSLSPLKVYNWWTN